jgi:hypothetical protein
MSQRMCMMLPVLMYTAKTNCSNEQFKRAVAGIAHM